MAKTIQKIYSKYRTTKYKKGDIILMQNIVPDSAYAIKNGIIRVYTTTSAECDERSISFVTKNEVFPICWLFSKTEATLFYYIAHTDCELYVIDKDNFLKDIVESPSASYALLDHTINDYVTKALQITALEQPRAIDKILHTFNYFSLRYGRQLIQDVVRITIPLTQKDIASFCGMARETVATELSKVRNKNIISSKNKFYTVNLTNLRAFTDDEQSEYVDIAEDQQISS